MGAQPEEPPDDVRDVAAEHAAVRVELVDDDDPELLEQLEPLGVVGEDRRVEHVRVRDDDLAGAADRRPDRAPGVSPSYVAAEIVRPAARDSSANSATWSWPRALVGKRNRARAAGSSAIAWRTGSA